MATDSKGTFPARGNHAKRSTAMTQLLIMQELLFKDANDEACKGAKRAMITRAWKELQELKLRLQMKAPPKPVDVTDLQKAKERRKAAQANGQPSGWRSKGKRGPGGPAASPAPPAPAQNSPT